MAVTEDDAMAAGRPRAQLSAEYAEIIRHTVTIYRQEHTWRSLLHGLLFSVIATAVFVSVRLILFRLRRAARHRLQKWVRTTEESFSPRSLRSRMARYFVVPVASTGVIFLTVAVVVLLEIYVTLVLGYFPSTRYTAFRMHRWTISELAGLANVVWTYLPNLIVAVIIVVAARYLLRLNRYIFKEIEDGTLSVRGFYADWAEPTAKLVRAS
jgi:hypothetical protein